ncbi:MAG: biopolymer transporter ExbD [Bdellovibrionota bacterium]
MAKGKFRDKADSTFDINLAPMLDVIVAIVPMLLMSVVFLRVNMIEAQIPQIVAEAIENNKNKPNPVTVALVIQGTTYKFEVTVSGKKSDIVIAAVDGKPNMDALYREALAIKRKHQDIFKLEIKPSKEISLDRIVMTLDKIRKIKTGEEGFTIKDEKTGNTAKTDLMFPEIAFADILEG